MNRYIFYRWLGLYIDHWLYHDISSSPNDLPISDEPRTCLLGGSWEDSRTKAVTAVRRDVGKRVKMVVILWDFLWDLYWNFLWFLWDFYGITYFSMGFSCELRKSWDSIKQADHGDIIWWIFGDLYPCPDCSLPSGKLSHSYGKSSFLMGKSTITGNFQ